MKSSIDNASARHDTGGPSSVSGRGADRNNRPRRADRTELQRDIAGLVDRSTQDLRLAWRQLHRTGPPPGLSRDLLIRALAYQLQERTEGGAIPALLRRLQGLAAEFEKGPSCSNSRIMLKTGTMLVRQWRGHAHTVLVGQNGFEYDGQRYRSLTVIAEKITGAHWSGPRFFASRCLSRHRSRPMTRSASISTRRNPRVRRAIYTRRSSEEGFEQEFNSLQAQREACESFINSQRHEGWVCLPACYDDGGFSGATIDRPALQRLLADITTGRVDIMVVYKIDRLTRSLHFNATLAGSGGTPFAALAKQEGVSASYFSRLVRLSYLAPDITQAISRAPAIPGDRRQAAGALTSAIGLARSTEPARLCLSRSEPQAPPKSLTRPHLRAGAANLANRVREHCGTEL